MESTEQQPKVGVGVIIFKDGKVLLGKRKVVHGAGSYASPGGHLEHWETFEECAIRECREECGLEIENIRFLLVANLRVYKPKHYVHIALLADWKSGEPQNLEPDKCEGWEWYDLNKLPHGIMATTKLALDNLTSGKNYFPDIS